MRDNLHKKLKKTTHKRSTLETSCAQISQSVEEHQFLPRQQGRNCLRFLVFQPTQSELVAQDDDLPHLDY